MNANRIRLTAMGAGAARGQRATFNCSDFDITPPKIAGFVSVEEDVTLQMQIVAQAI